MSEQHSNLDRALSELTKWPGEDAATWKAAATSAAFESKERHAVWWNRNVPYGPLAAVIVVCGFLAFVFLPSLGEARRSVRGPAALSASAVRAEADAATQKLALREDFAPTAPLFASDRSIIRRFDLEFTSPDVRATFKRLPGLLSEARGEYIEQSAFGGTGLNATASATLRVPADRLGAVLASLRELGTLCGESSSGDDVTEQVVDLDARLRNEQRVEKELLSLLDSRNGAPLKAILELRESLRTVREQIERLSAQQQRIGRLVSLATIRVSIRTEPAQPAAPAGFWTTASSRIGSTWNDSLKIALDAFAGLLAVVVGGAVWWFLLAVGGFVAWKIWNRRLTLAAFEPPPQL